MEEEIWKDVVGYEGLYMVSSHGRIMALDRTVLCKNGMKIKKPKTILKPSISKKGYYAVKLSKNNKGTSFRLSRIVCMHFIENTERKPEVNHKDANKANNHKDNLEWCTRQENINHVHQNNLWKKPKWTIESRLKNSESLKKYRKRLREQGLTHNNLPKSDNLND
jgi:hypothetical protein